MTLALSTPGAEMTSHPTTVTEPRPATFVADVLQFSARPLSLPLLVPQCPFCGSSEQLTIVERTELATSDARAGAGAVLTFVCEQCEQACSALSVCVASVPDPAGIGHCAPQLFAQRPDRFRQFAAEAATGESWTINRRIFTTGRMPDGEAPLLPRGPFAIDEHLFPTVVNLDELSGAIALMRRLLPAAAELIAASEDTPISNPDIRA